MVPLYPSRTSAVKKRWETADHQMLEVSWFLLFVCLRNGVFESVAPLTICLAQLLYTCSCVQFVGNTLSNTYGFPCETQTHTASTDGRVQMCPFNVKSRQKTDFTSDSLRLNQWCETEAGPLWAATNQNDSKWRTDGRIDNVTHCCYN